MPITYIKGDLLESGEKLIAHGCNAQGVMGSGIAKSIRAKYPVVFKAYREMYEYNCVQNTKNHLDLGATQFVDVSDNSMTVVNCITQEHYGSDYARYKFVSYDAIYDCFKRINSYMNDMKLKEIGIPMIGAGRGGGDWKVISSIIESCMPDKQIKVYCLE